MEHAGGTQAFDHLVLQSGRLKKSATPLPDPRRMGPQTKIGTAQAKRQFGQPGPAPVRQTDVDQPPGLCEVRILEKILGTPYGREGDAGPAGPGPDLGGFQPADAVMQGR